MSTDDSSPEAPEVSLDFGNNGDEDDDDDEDDDGGIPIF